MTDLEIFADGLQHFKPIHFGHHLIGHHNILTAKNDEGAKTKAITLGANAYITKPFSKEYLLARIDQLLAERKLFRERIRQQMENQTTTEEDSYEQFLVM